MNIYAVNASPRKNRNTALILKSALEGAASVEHAEAIHAELIHINDLPFSACISCFECKRTASKSYGKCALNDALTPIIEKLSAADGIFFGSPVYFGNITGKMKSLLERLLFPYCTYDEGYATISPKKMPVSFIYTMNVDKTTMEALRYPENFAAMEMFLGMVFSKPDVIYVNNTYQFDDYSKYTVRCFSEHEKRTHKETQFPVDCQSAFNLGKNMVLSILNKQ